MKLTKEIEYLQIKAYSDHPEVLDAAHLLVEAYFEGKSRRRDVDKLMRDAKKLVASLWLHPSDLFRFTTKTAYFSGDTRKQVWLTNRVLKLFKLMCEIGWVNKAFGAITPVKSTKNDGTGMAAIYARSVIFRKLLQSLTVKDIHVNTDLPRIILTVEPDDADNVIDRKTKLPVDHRKHALDSYTQWVCLTLEQHWALLLRFRFKKASGEDLPWNDIYYHNAIRPNTVSGRFYAGFCTYPKKERLGITIDDEPVAALDLSQIHPKMLLALNGLNSESQMQPNHGLPDVYAMPEYAHLPRQVHKGLINILFNSNSLLAAKRAFLNTYLWVDPETHELAVKTYKGKTRTKRRGEPVMAPNKLTEAQKYIDSFLTYHPAFAQSICCQQSGNLQSFDSNIVINTIDLMTQAELPVLTIHDEFIVRERDRAFIESVVGSLMAQTLEDLGAIDVTEVDAKWETLFEKTTVTLPVIKV